MERDFGNEIDMLKEELAALRRQMTPRTELRIVESGPEALKKLQKSQELKKLALERGTSGYVSYTGFFRNEAFQNGSIEEENANEAYWGSEGVCTDSLLNLDDRKVTVILNSLANRPRLAILKEILKHPATAAELVERLKLGTTGQVYHHLKALEAADFITNDGGIFRFRGHRVQSLLMILAGVNDALDETYTHGRLEEVE